ncbi:MAG: hypothetical protein PHQ65_15705 [Bacteroidales bacterium]|nr:hypothetical protein [Bacteroidales bacterium]MDD3666711.1 hypothetical protein [Bacteroidales bacterium]
MIRTLAQNKQMHTLFSKLRIDHDTKEELVYAFSAGRVSSSAKLTVEEARQLIDYLMNMAGDKQQRADLGLIRQRYRLYHTIREKGYLPQLKGKEAMETLDNFAFRRWNELASEMNSTRLGELIGVVKKWRVRNAIDQQS